MQALLWESCAESKVRCQLCSHRCIVKPGKRGLCGVRENQDGALHTLVYGKLIAQNIDPIEKKPLFHLYPGSRSYSVATVGCNFKCEFCQNADIAQMPADRAGLIMGKDVTPAEIVAAARAADCRTIAYTYTEPTVYFELAYETARLAKESGISNVFVTNGYMTAEAFDLIAPYLDAANVDLKAFTDDFYKHYCGARLKPVKETLVRMKQGGVMVEVTTLIIPGLNDDRALLAELAGFLVHELGPDTPWHISRFHPTYRLTDRGVTPEKTLIEARRIGLDAGLHHVYIGNVPGSNGESTSCPGCERVVIERVGYQIRGYHLEEGRCAFCGTPADGVGM
ncbi:MAG: COG1180: Radical SAM, Pyruvate-formate lyase-activating enzyme like [Olavius algarvensis Delta 4 endosymbiont]|nr:MAG: COG1180: Radical SAM, Pyruvate-formate lyase-activating enzyme like [Olavius algarvensis Delta 4 endosymbiont]